MNCQLWLGTKHSIEGLCYIQHQLLICLTCLLHWFVCDSIPSDPQNFGVFDSYDMVALTLSLTESQEWPWETLVAASDFCFNSPLLMPTFSLC